LAAGPAGALARSVKALRVGDPAVGMLWQHAETALMIADHATAGTKLAEARLGLSR
jgi:hypothetical protein